MSSRVSHQRMPGLAYILETGQAAAPRLQLQHEIYGPSSEAFLLNDDEQLLALLPRKVQIRARREAGSRTA